MLYRDPQRARREIPVLAMLEVSEAELQARAERLCEAIGNGAAVVRSTGKVGGGALPLLELEGPAVALAQSEEPLALMQALREADPPVIARIHDGRVLLDPRTLSAEDLELAVTALGGALRALARE